MPWWLVTCSVLTSLIFQEILDEIVDIDLVLNFKCADNCFMKRRSGGDICTHCGQLFDASSPVSRERNLSLGSPSWHGQAQPASIIGLENPRMEKMRAYAEQVFFSLANPSESIYLVRIVLNLLCTQGTGWLKIYLTMPVVSYAL
jgi:hypothetical protein